MLETVKAGKTYRNIKTGRLYRVLHIVTASWDIEQLLAVYEPVGGGSPWARSVTEFREKFEEAENA
ncbi:MAG: hypothetical protein Pg6C_00680 [Treponemataceae bacterium]|nr:MAG: hypothetical protein Pg6C_00680 [Treponemataceae bacterium]